MGTKLSNEECRKLIKKYENKVKDFAQLIDSVLEELKILI